MSVTYRTTSYGDFLTHFGALVGVDPADFNTTELNMARSFFNRAFRKAWESQIWTDLCPQGEVRFPSNLLTFSNDMTQVPPWIQVDSLVASQSTNNPLDNRTTASLVTEATGTGNHGVYQVAAFAPSQTYTFSGYAKPSGRTWLYVVLNDSSLLYTAFFNLTQFGGGPSVGTIGGSGPSSSFPACSIQALSNGWYFWTMTVTTTAFASAGEAQVYFSPDGTTTSYTGTLNLGAYMWGVTCYLQQNTVPASYIVPWSQSGESGIDSVYNVWSSDPGASNLPRKVKYLLNPNGIEIIGTATMGPIIISPAATNQTAGAGVITPGPVYLYYRPQRPVFAGSNYNALSTYAYGNTMYYTTTAGVSNFYTCIVATTAGQNPDTNPASWSVIPIPYVLFEYCVYDAYANWLQTEGQAAKAQAAYAYAQTCLDDENDRQERQNGHIMPWKVQTHLTSRPGLAR